MDTKEALAFARAAGHYGDDATRFRDAMRACRVLAKRVEELEDHYAARGERVEELAEICERLDNARMAAMDCLRQQEHAEPGGWVAKAVEILVAAEAKGGET